jgi:hypothetical protein
MLSELDRSSRSTITPAIKASGARSLALGDGQRPAQLGTLADYSAGSGTSSPITTATADAAAARPDQLALEAQAERTSRRPAIEDPWSW